MMFIPRFVKIGQLVQTLNGGTRTDSMEIAQAGFISWTKKILLETTSLEIIFCLSLLCFVQTCSRRNEQRSRCTWEPLISQVRKFCSVGWVVENGCVDYCDFGPFAIFKCTESFEYELFAGLLSVVESIWKDTDNICLRVLVQLVLRRWTVRPVLITWLVHSMSRPLDLAVAGRRNINRVKLALQCTATLFSYRRLILAAKCGTGGWSLFKILFFYLALRNFKAVYSPIKIWTHNRRAFWGSVRW